MDFTQVKDLRFINEDDTHFFSPFHEANLAGTYFLGSNLSGLNLRYAKNVEVADFEDATMEGTILTPQQINILSSNRSLTFEQLRDITPKEKEPLKMREGAIATEIFRQKLENLLNEP